MNEEQIRQIIREELAQLIRIDRYVFEKNIQILDARNIQVGKTNGTSIGTETTQKLSVYGVTPIVQQGEIGAPTGGGTVDAQSRTAISSLISAIKNFGITA